MNGTADGRVETSGFAERERGAREARGPVGMAARGRHVGEAPDRMRAEPARSEPSCDRRHLLEAGERVLEMAFEQLDPAEVHQRKTGSAGVVDEPGELERLVQPAAGGGGVPVPQGEFREVREPEGGEREIANSPA